MYIDLLIKHLFYIRSNSNEKSSVITSVSTCRSDVSLSDWEAEEAEEAEVTEELSDSELSSSSPSCCTGMLQQPWHSHAGPQ